MSFRDRLDAFCATLPGAQWADPADGQLASWKVGGKMFACTGTTTPGVSVKTADAATAQMLIDAGVAEKAPYFHASWVRLPESVPEDELRHRLTSSYDLILRGLPKKTQAELSKREAV
ncbi:MAG: MmcQ/YjbR family DNA-binding protein [Pseudomonadota bacterium]